MKLFLKIFTSIDDGESLRESSIGNIGNESKKDIYNTSKRLYIRVEAV